MKRIFSSKQKRKQAENKIISEMQHILSDLEDHRKKADKERIMSVLTNFLKLKKDGKVH